MAGEIMKYQNAVDIIKTAILQSQARAAKAVNQEQLANLPNFPLAEFFYAGYIMQDFRQPMGVATYKTTIWTPNS